MDTKRCSKCGEEKDRSEFSVSKAEKDGLCIYCKECYRKKHKEWRDKNIEHVREYGRKQAEKHKQKRKIHFKENYEKNKQKYNERSAKWYRENKHKQKQLNANWYQLNKEKTRIKNKKWRELNKDKVKIHNRKGTIKTLEKIKTDSFYHLKKSIRNRIALSIKRNGYSKRSSVLGLLLCSFEDFMAYLGPKPEGNYHLDHICPCKQAQNEEELIKLQHYTNFRWMPAADNISKSDSWTQEGEEMCRKLLGRDWIY